tara:strand:- start:239 stop:532 length:294 start_codon:yes stop_codon:yes gene_type:complete
MKKKVAYTVRKISKELQDQAMAYIFQFKRDNSMTPTQKILSQKLNVNQSTISLLLKNLEDRGKILRGSGNYVIMEKSTTNLSKFRGINKLVELYKGE